MDTKKNDDTTLLDDWLEIRSLSDLDLQHVTATLHAAARVHLLAEREQVARTLARFAMIAVSEAEHRGLTLEPPPPSATSGVPGSCLPN